MLEGSRSCDAVNTAPGWAQIPPETCSDKKEATEQVYHLGCNMHIATYIECFDMFKQLKQPYPNAFPNFQLIINIYDSIIFSLGVHNHKELH